MPEKVQQMLAALPELARGGTLELRVAAVRLREAGLLSRSGSSTKLFGQFADRFELLPPGNPNHVRLRAALAAPEPARGSRPCTARVRSAAAIETRAAALTFRPLPTDRAPVRRTLTMKRVLLFIVTNLAVMLVLGIAASLLGVNRFLTANGLNLGMLLGFAALMGFGGAIISLLISKPMAKWSTEAQVINDSADPTHRWIVGTVQGFAQKAGIGMPEVAIYDGEPNAFATGAFKNSALVAVSTGLLHSMNRDEVEAVIGHEVAHVANGDMVTLTLIQGVMNTFVVFLSRVIGYFVDKVILKNDREGVGHRLLRHDHRARHRARRAGRRHRGLVLAPARIPRRRRRRGADGPQAADDQCAGAPGRAGPRRAAARRWPTWASAAGPAA